MITDTVGPARFNPARRPSSATPRSSMPAAAKPQKVRNGKGLETGASRIPCPRPVAIGPSSLLPGAVGQDFVPYVAGLDKLLVSFWLEGEGFDEFRHLLQEFKEEFNDEKLCGPEVSERAFNLGWEGVSFNMFRTGAGKYPYKLQSGDLVLKFSNHKPTASFPNCCLEIHSMSCWNPGWKAVLSRFFELLEHLGCSVCKQTVTEYHITADLMDVDFTRTGLIDHRRWLTKAPKRISSTYEYYIPNYISFGKGDFMLRCYDKTAELKHDDVKRDFFYNIWYGRAGYVPEHVTRIEFQIRRAVSKELQINTIEDLETNLDAIWRYCAGFDDNYDGLNFQAGWSRFCSKKLTEKDRKNKHQSRYATAFLWEFVRSLRFSNAPEPPVKLERIKPPPQTNIDFLCKQFTGYALSICAASGFQPDWFQQHIAFAQQIIAEQIPLKHKKNHKEYIRKMETKRNLARVTLFS
jgi:hypothetical protein